MNIRSGLICVPSREKERKLRELLILYLYLAELKDYPMYTTAYYPDLSMLPARVATTSSIIRPISPTVVDTPLIYKCDLCNTLFNTEEELNRRVTSNH
jgi:hypothetical protein